MTALPDRLSVSAAAPPAGVRPAWAGAQLPVACPYCDSGLFEVDAPPLEEAPGGPAPEIVALPYTRDIGRFDPKAGQQHGTWGRVGRDFFSVLGWERIGVLRSAPGQHVYYRVARCPRCGYLFDLYANYTPARRLSAMWPHLLAEAGAGGRAIRLYDGITYSLRLIGTHPEAAGGLIFLIYLLSFLPALAGYPWTAAGLGQFFAAEWVDVLARATGALAVFAMLSINYRQVKLFRDEQALRGLIAVREPRGVTHWCNYTLCRFVGVQSGQPGYTPTQATMAAGIPAVLVLLATWFDLQVVPTHRWGIWAALEMLLFVASGYVLGCLIEARRHPAAVGGPLRARLAGLIVPIRTAGLLAAGGALLLWSALNLPASFAGFTALQLAGTLAALVFWLGVGYYLGVGAWWTMNTTVYVLTGLRRLPLRLEPLERFAALRAIEPVGLLSTLGMLTLFLFVIVLAIALVFLQTGSDLNWILFGVQAGFLLLTVVMAVFLGGSTRALWLVLVAVYVILQSGLSSAPGAQGWLIAALPVLGVAPFSPQNGPQVLWADYLRLAFLGVLLANVLVFQSRRVYRTFYELRAAAKQRKLAFYDEKIQALEARLHAAPDAGAWSRAEAEEAGALLGTLNGLLAMRAAIEQVDVNPLDGARRRWAAAGSLIGTSIVLPFLLELFMRYVLP